MSLDCIVFSAAISVAERSLNGCGWSSRSLQLTGTAIPEKFEGTAKYDAYAQQWVYFLHFLRFSTWIASTVRVDT